MSFDNRCFAMNLLAFDTSTEHLSAAVAREGVVVAHTREAGGAQASAALIPALQALLAQAGLQVRELDAIVFGRGPGSFTGLRTACAVAQGLGFGSAVPVLGIETLLAVAEEARGAAGATRVVAMLDARMGEVYAAPYEFDEGQWRRTGEIVLGKPEAVDVPDGWSIAGNVLDVHGKALPAQAPRVEAWPSAPAMLRLAERLVAEGAAQDAAHAAPVYIRDKVALTTDERAQQRASASLPS
jgi:tRNA threonylcarbamoyladenosine biosynthesis protein TsaB